MPWEGCQPLQAGHRAQPRVGKRGTHNVRRFRPGGRAACFSPQPPSAARPTRRGAAQRAPLGSHAAPPSIA